MSETAESAATEGVERFNVAMGEGLASRVDAAAQAAGTNRSAQVRELACRGLASMLRDGAADPAASQVTVVFPDGAGRRLTAEVVSTAVLPACAGTVCEDASWLGAVPEEVRAAMATQVTSAAAGLGAEELPLRTVVSVACVLAANPACPWMVSARTRKDAVARATRDLEALAEDDAASPAQLASAAARRLLLPVCDVVGAPPEGPVRMLAAVLQAGGAPESPLARARASLQELLGATEGEMAQLAEAASPAPEADDVERAEAARTIAKWACSLAEDALPKRSGHAPSARKRRAAFRPRGAEEIVALATEKPRATLPELEAAAGVSHSTLQRRLAELDSAGIMHNAGTSRSPLWQVAGTEHDPEDLLTDVQRRVLESVRQDPLRQRTDVAAALGVSPSLVSKAYHELAYLGLVRRSGRGWAAT